MRKVLNFLLYLLKQNIAFGLGMVLGSVIGTTTTIMFTMSYFGVEETVVEYQKVICGETK